MAVNDQLGGGVETRGFVAKNGRGQWCFFAHSRANGVPIAGALLNEVRDAPARNVPLASLPDENGTVR